MEHLLGNKPKNKDLAMHLGVTSSAISQYSKEKRELMLLGLWIRNNE